MKKASLITMGFVAAVAATQASTALAFVAPQPRVKNSMVTNLLAKSPVVIRPELKTADGQNFAKRFEARTQIEVDARSGAVRLLTGDLARTTRVAANLTASDLIDVATNWIAAHEDILQIQLEDISVVEDATLISDDVQFISFSVSRDGTTIADAALNFRFKRGQLVQVMARTFGEALDDARSEFISATAAVEKISTLPSIQEQGQVYRVKATEKGYQLVRVNKALVQVDGDTLAVQTDAATGDIFETRDTRSYINGRAHGNVYARTYYQSQPLDVGMMFMSVKTTGATTVNSDATGSFSFTGTATPSISGVAGQFISVKNKSGAPLSRTATSINGLWNLNLDVSAEKDASQVHTFHHLNLVIEKAKKYISSSWMDRPMTANVNLSQTCNAYWDGSTVNFFSAGGGCGNTGLISDVMYHEWGHGLDANTGGIVDGAYSEGFGDIVSMVMTGDSKLGPGFRSNGGIVRDMEPDKIYPRDSGEVHAEGLIIGGTFWDLYKALSAKYTVEKANDLVSTIAFKTIFTAVNYTDVYNAALVVNDNDSNPATKAPDFCEINAAFSAHGLATKDTACP